MYYSGCGETNQIFIFEQEAKPLVIQKSRCSFFMLPLRATARVAPKGDILSQVFSQQGRG
jgi:hypothetical protein